MIPLASIGITSQVNPDVRVREATRQAGIEAGYIAALNIESSIATDVREHGQRQQGRQAPRQDNDNISPFEVSTSFPAPASTLFLAQLLAQQSGSSEVLADFARMRVVKFAPSYAGVTFTNVGLLSDTETVVEETQLFTIANDNFSTATSFNNYKAAVSVPAEQAFQLIA